MNNKDFNELMTKAKEQFRNLPNLSSEKQKRSSKYLSSGFLNEETALAHKYGLATSLSGDKLMEVKHANYFASDKDLKEYKIKLKEIKDSNKFLFTEKSLRFIVDYNKSVNWNIQGYNSVLLENYNNEISKIEEINPEFKNIEELSEKYRNDLNLIYKEFVYDFLEANDELYLYEKLIPGKYAFHLFTGANGASIGDFVSTMTVNNEFFRPTTGDLSEFVFLQSLRRFYYNYRSTTHKLKEKRP